ncbi:MAG: cyclic nucleotide-binding domain-containing protein [Xanthomonadales bacterium]|nr:cyclic nucleotide-binding domain-containing protein [Xanthomonadales bacterium]NNL94256.1 cyclic nucleotide-binding domain-containing protein [Xanthomonadales bacterium]
MDLEQLQRIDIFRSLDPSDAKLVAERMEIICYPRNSLMIHEGEENSSLYVILKGKVKIFLLDETGQEVILNYLHEGDHFGEVSLFDDGHRSASVQTMDDCYFGTLQKEDFVQIMATHPNLAMTMFKGMTRRLKDLSNNVRTLAANW